MIEFLVSVLILVSGMNLFRHEGNTTVKVNSLSSLQKAISQAKPGDRIIVDNGTYAAAENILIAVQGARDNPVIVEAETIGGVELNGSGGFQICSPSAYVVVRGFRFTNKSGNFRIDPGATNCLITRNLFECVPSGTKGARAFLTIAGDNNEISYNTFQNKKDEGQMISVQGPGNDRMAKHTRIHHNYFTGFPPTANNCSAIQIGLSGRSMDSAFCVVEYNLFERTEGENEGAICHKSCNNTIRFNTFGERSEECSIRHGNKSIVYGNYFINTTGLRFSGDDHLIFGNYFLNCKKAIVCSNGDGEVKEGSKLTCHDRPDRVKIAGNIMVGCESDFEMPERKDGLGATHITFTDNLLRGGSPVSIKGSYTFADWSDNIIWDTTGGDMPQSGYRTEDVSVDEFRASLNNKTGYPEIPLTNRILTVDDVGQYGR